MGFDPPAKLPPLKLHWDKEAAKKVRPSRIPYTSEQKEFLNYYCTKLIKHGYAYVNPRSRYVSESLAIPKVVNPVSLEDDWRLVMNFKKANAATEVTHWPLPTMEEVQQHLVGAKYFIILDLKNGYWQIRLHADSQELLSLCTHKTVLSPTRILQGCTDAVTYFTYLMMLVFEKKIHNGILPWLDDLLLYTKSRGEAFELLKWVLERAQEIELKFSVKKKNSYVERDKGRSETSRGTNKHSSTA